MSKQLNNECLNNISDGYKKRNKNEMKRKKKLTQIAKKT